MTYAADTSVSIERSRAEIESILGRYGATRFGYMTEETKAIIVFEAHGKAVKFVLPLPSRGDPEFTRKTRYKSVVECSPEEAHARWEQACRSKWRSMALCVKAKLEACASEITTFEKEFLAHFVVKDGRTVGDFVIPQLETMQRTGKLPGLALMAGSDV